MSRKSHYKLILHQDGSCKSVDDYKEDFDFLNKISPNPPSTPLKQLDPHTEKLPIVRTYAQVDRANQSAVCNVSGTILPAAHDKGFKVVIGLWYVSNCGAPCIFCIGANPQSQG